MQSAMSCVWGIHGVWFKTCQRRCCGCSPCLTLCLRHALPSCPVSFSAAVLPSSLLQAIFEEFNTLSVVYQQPAALFVQSAQYQLHEEEPEPEQVLGVCTSSVRVCWCCVFTGVVAMLGPDG